MRRPTFSSLVITALGLAASIASAEPPADLPPEFKQIIPRGKIASIDTPGFVSATRLRGD